MSGVFISYRREDSSGYAGRLYDRLAGHFGEARIFMDVSTIEAGEDFTRAIDQHLSSCKVLLALLGKQWLTLADAGGVRRLDDPRDFVRLEITTALGRSVRVIPVLVQGAKMPSGHLLPADLEPLSRRHAVEITDANFHRDVDGLIRAMQGIFAGPDPAGGQMAGARPVVGQVVIGHAGGQYNLHIGSTYGGVIHNAPAENIARLDPRPAPVIVRPRPMPGILDRESESHSAEQALLDGLPVQFYGDEGAGKTSLLRHLAHAPFGSSFPDGLLYLAARGKPPSDLLQELFEAFFDTHPLYKPGDAEIRRLLQNKKALVLMDDAGLSKEALDELMNAAPASVFLSTSATRTLWGEGRAIALKGLPEEASLALLERELGHSLAGGERIAALAVFRSVLGNPLQLLQMAAKAQEDGVSINELGQAPGAGDTLPAQPPERRRILCALAAFGGAPASAQQLAAFTGQSDAGAHLESLSRSGLVRAEAGRYRLTQNLVSVLQQLPDFAATFDSLLSHFADWAERSGEEPAALQEESGGMLALLECAAGKGQWSKARRLARAIEPALALARRWGSWSKVLGWQLDAARAMNDSAGEAWALHQLGTQHLCLGDAASAKDFLGRAAGLREAIGDHEGAALSRHNLEQLGPVPPAERRPSETSKSASRFSTSLLLKVAAAVSVFAVPVTIYYFAARPRETPPVVEPPPAAQAVVDVPGAGEKKPAPSKPPAEPLEPRVEQPPAPAPKPVVQQPVEVAPPPQAQEPENVVRVSPTGLAFSSLEVNTESANKTLTESGAAQLRRRRVTQSEERRIRVWNEGTALVKIFSTSISGPQAGDFTVTGDSCRSAELEPGGRCSITVGFAPQAPGTRSAVLMIEHTGPGTPAVVNLSGAGTAPTPE